MTVLLIEQSVTLLQNPAHKTNMRFGTHPIDTECIHDATPKGAFLDLPHCG